VHPLNPGPGCALQELVKAETVQTPRRTPPHLPRQFKRAPSILAEPDAEKGLRKENQPCIQEKLEPYRSLSRTCDFQVADQALPGGTRPAFGPDEDPRVQIQNLNEQKRGQRKARHLKDSFRLSWMTAEAKERNQGKRDGEVSPGAARAGQSHARRQGKRDQQRGKETQRIPRMEKSDGNHRAAEIIREIVGLVDRAEHRVDRLYGYVSAGGGQRNARV